MWIILYKIINNVNNRNNETNNSDWTLQTVSKLNCLHCLSKCQNRMLHFLQLVLQWATHPMALLLVPLESESRVLFRSSHQADCPKRSCSSKIMGLQSCCALLFRQVMMPCINPLKWQGSPMPWMMMDLFFSVSAASLPLTIRLCRMQPTVTLGKSKLPWWMLTLQGLTMMQCKLPARSWTCHKTTSTPLMNYWCLTGVEMFFLK